MSDELSVDFMNTAQLKEAVVRLRAELAAERERKEHYAALVNAMTPQVATLRETLAALAEHCNDMEAQNHDYHALGEGDQPRLSRPLADAYAVLRETGGA